MTIHLKGITWNHSRGIMPMFATAQRFMETHSNVKITWERRSLQEFADAPIDHLANAYDLLVIDHPWAGFAAESKILLPLEKFLPDDFLIDQQNNSIGRSHISYNFNGFQAALAIDAATPVASYRNDLFQKLGEKVPNTWNELLMLAKQGLVILPGLEVDSTMNFYMFCIAHGEEPFLSEEIVVSEDKGVRALESFRELTTYCTKRIFEWNPIKVYEELTNSDEFLYCPFAYSYSNYSRSGYSKYTLTFTDMIKFNDKRLVSTLGGTGLAISSKCENVDVAVEYALYVASPMCQKTLFFENGGQPGYRSAWGDNDVNRMSNNFFKNTLATHDRAYLRPRYNGYLYFQDNAGSIIQEYLRNGGNPKKVLEKLNKLYRDSREGVQIETT